MNNLPELYFTFKVAFFQWWKKKLENYQKNVMLPFTNGGVLQDFIGNSTGRNTIASAKLWKQIFPKVSTRNIGRMCEDGKLKYWKLGPRYIRFNLDDVLATMQQPELN